MSLLLKFDNFSKVNIFNLIFLLYHTPQSYLSLCGRINSEDKMFNSSEYLISSNSYNVDYDDRKSIFLLGRSNVGKSSLINSILNRKNLARISSTPGKTITLNYYLVNKKFYIVDAPGYGYAKRSKQSIETYYKMLNDFLENQKELVLICLLIDFKVGPTKDDIDVYNQLIKYKKPLIVVATKVDKIAKTKRNKKKKEIQSLLPQNIIEVSNTKKIGIIDLQKIILKKIEE